jgi:hypothetical protein
MDQNMLEERIFRAQRAILNPSIPTQTFLEGGIDPSAPNELTFSSNIVCLEITGPDYSDISFVDLPGPSPKTQAIACFSNDDPHRPNSYCWDKWKPQQHSTHRGLGGRLYQKRELYYPRDNHL